MDMEKKKKKINEIINRIAKDQKFRRELVRQSHFYFFQTFFQDYLEYSSSWFHKEMFALSEDQSKKIIAIMAFRDSGKSTIMNFSFALWSILGKLQKKFVLIIGRSGKQTKVHFENIKNEMECNKLLMNDLGPFRAESDEWGTNFLELKKFNAKIMMISAKQSVRGLRYGPHRPDLIICDDIEDMLSVQNKNERDEIYQWFMSEIFTIGDKKTTIVILGNLLHEESLLLKIKDQIEKGNLPGIFRAYPLLDDNNRIVWPEKFRTPEEVLEFKKTIPDEEVWNREYLLRVTGMNLLLRICRTRKDVEEKWGKEEAIFEVKKAPSDPRDYCISAPIFEETKIRIISREPDGRVISREFDEDTEQKIEKSA